MIVCFHSTASRLLSITPARSTRPWVRRSAAASCCAPAGTGSTPTKLGPPSPRSRADREQRLDGDRDNQRSWTGLASGRNAASLAASGAECGRAADALGAADARHAPHGLGVLGP